jgi:hypothetical protein
MDDLQNNPVDQAIAQRLRRLSTMPMDLSRLEASLRKERRSSAPPTLWARILRPASAVAASFLVLVLIAAIVLTGSSGPAMASQMAQVHRDMVSGRIQVTAVDSIDAASRVLAETNPAMPELPQAPEAHVMACCMRDVSDKKVAHVLLKSEGSPITMSVASATDFKPMGKVVRHNGAGYHVVSHETLNMVSTERAGRWVCLIGELPTDRLIAVAEKLQF